MIVKIEPCPAEQGGYTVRFDNGAGHFKARAYTLEEVCEAVRHGLDSMNHSTSKACPICRSRLLAREERGVKTR